MWRLATILIFTLPVLAQQIGSADKLAPVLSAVDAGQRHNSLPCSVQFTQPKLNLAFRFQAGYSARVPLDSYMGAEHRWRIVFRVTPANGQPAYFVDTIDLPPPQERGFDAINSGLFFTGEGHYDVQWSMWDDLDRVCRKEWSFDAHRSKSEHDLKVAMPPGTVGDLSWQAAPPGEGAVAKSRRITILLNAALPLTKQAQPAKGEWTTLLTILSSLLERMPEADFRLVVFNLDQRQELFSKDSFTAADLSGIANAADATGRWKIESQTLQNPNGAWDLIGNLVSGETHGMPSPDTIVFLGLPEAGIGAMPVALQPRDRSSAPRFAYLLYSLSTGNPPGFSGRFGADAGTSKFSGGGRSGNAGAGLAIGRSYPNPSESDPIEQLVRSRSGKTIIFSSPDELDKAITDLRHLP